MSLSLGDLADVIDAIAPFKDALDFDNVGLQIGDRNQRVRRILFVLDVTKQVVREAVRLNVDAIVSHHPLIFDPLKKINLSLRTDSLVADLLKNGIGLIVAHTNLDVSPEGTNKALVELIGLSDMEPLSSHSFEEHYKLVVFTPSGYERKLIDAINRGGGGVIGNYSHCTFRAPGTGTFVPREGTSPFIGSKNRLEEVDEFRLETIVPKHTLDAVLEEILKAHPYEEVAYDIYPVKIRSRTGPLGMKSKINPPLTLEEFARRVKKRLRCDSIGMVKGRKRKLSKVALCSGTGDGLFSNPGLDGVDVLLVGDLKYYSLLHAQDMGLSVITAGHFHTEFPGMRRLATLVADRLPVKRSSVRIHISRAGRSPLVIL